MLYKPPRKFKRNRRRNQLAQPADLNRVTLSRALFGQRHPRLDTLTKVTDPCGVKLRSTA